MFINDISLKIALQNFWKEVMSKYTEDQYISIQFKVLLSNKDIRSISYLQLVNKNDFK